VQIRFPISQKTLDDEILSDVFHRQMLDESLKPGCRREFSATARRNSPKPGTSEAMRS